LWKLENNSLMVALDEDDPEKYDRLCERVEVIEKQVDLLTGEETLVVELAKPYGNKRITLSRDKYTQRSVVKTLERYGLSLIECEESVAVIKEVLYTTEEKAPVHFKHTALGFLEFRNDLCFLAHHPIGNFSAFEQKSEFESSKNFLPKGSLKEWRKFILKEIVPSSKLSLLLALGTTAPVAYILKDNGIFTDVPLWGLIGESSTGKTTLLTLVGSMFSNPLKTIQSFDATSNAFFALLKAQPGIPYLADEGTYTPYFDWDNLLYSLPAGREKRRCNGDGSVKPEVNFSGAVILTSERSIIERSKGFEGQKARIIEFSLPWFGEDGDKAERVKKQCYMNHGWAFEPIIKLLLAPEFKNKLIKKYTFYYKRLLNTHGNNINGVDRRLLQRIALILVSGWVFQKALKIDLHLDNTTKLLNGVFIESSKEQNLFNPADDLLDYLSEQILMHNARFPHVSKCCKTTITDNIWGARGYNGNLRCVWILKDIFHEMLKKHNKYGVRNAMKLLAEKGYLRKIYGDRFLEETDLGILKANCYCLYFPQEATMSEIIASMEPYYKNIAAISKKLNEDPLGTITRDVEAVDRINANLKKYEKEKIVIGFIRITKYTGYLKLSSGFKEALALKHSGALYLTLVPSNNVLMLSSYPLIEQSLKLKFEVSAEGAWVYSPMIVTLLDTFDIELPVGSRFLCNDIELENKGSPVAIINMKSKIGSWTGRQSFSDPNTITDIDIHFENAKLDHSNLPNLLNDSDNEEDA